MLGTAGLVSAGAPVLAQFGRAAAGGATRLAATRLGQVAVPRLAPLGRAAAGGVRLARTPVDDIFRGAGTLALRQGTRAADALGSTALGRVVQGANQRVLSPLAQYSSRTGGFLNRAADATKDYFSLVNNFGRGPVLNQVTGARAYRLANGLAERRAAARAYDAIRNSTDDVARIARATGRTEAEIAQIKNHVFRQTHRTAKGMQRFDPDPQIVRAWERLRAGEHSFRDLAFLEHELSEVRLVRAGLSQEAAHAALARVTRPLRPDIPLVFQNPPPGISSKFLHDEYVDWVRPGARELTFETPWSASRGLGTRKFDDYDVRTLTGFEGNTTPWSEMTQQQLSRKLEQVGSDWALLRTDPTVQRIVWFGTDPLPTTGLGAQIREALEQAGIQYWVVMP
jgi:hypothetical protein